MQQKGTFADYLRNVFPSCASALSRGTSSGGTNSTELHAKIMSVVQDPPPVINIIQPDDEDSDNNYHVRMKRNFQTFRGHMRFNRGNKVASLPL